MSKPVFSDLFEFSSRRNRKSFALLHLALLVSGIVLGTLMEVGGVIMVIAGLIYFVTFIIGIANTIQRLHDLDKSGWWFLVFLIPIVNLVMLIYLLFAKGTPGTNSYGPDPLEGSGVAQFG